MNRRLRQPSWEEPLRTKHAAIARYQRSMLVCKALLLLTTLVIAAWVGIQQRDFPGNLGEGLLLGLLVPVAALLVASVYQLVVRLEDGDSPVFLGLTALVPVFNLLLVFISTTWHGNTFASRASRQRLNGHHRRAIYRPGGTPPRNGASGNVFSIARRRIDRQGMKDHQRQINIHRCDTDRS